MKKILAVMTAIGVGAMALSGCGQSQTQERPAETESQTVTESQTQPEDETQAESQEEGAFQEETQLDLDQLVFTYVTAPLNVPSIVEKNQGIFADAFSKYGLDVEYAEITSGADQTQALASGDVQVLYAVGGSSVILSAANGADIQIVNMYSRSPKAFCLYTKDESLTTPESLAGKTIAGPVGTNLHELLAAYLATADMTIEDVNYVNMSIPDAMAGLEGGSLDVAMLAGATAYQAEQSGYHLVTDGEGMIDASIAVAVTGEFAENYPQLVETLKEAQGTISDFMENHYEETMEIVAQELDLDAEAVKEMYTAYDFSTDVTESDIAGLQKTADFMLEAEMIDSAFDVNTLFAE